jgi:broad specificity phosphatase PhoE
MSRRVIVWRHGRTAWNVERRVQGQTDIPLDEVGLQQAREGAARLASLAPHRIVSSDMSRAADTAAVLGELTGITVEKDVRFRERSFGEREGLTLTESWQRFPEHMALWSDGGEPHIPGSETTDEAASRFVEAVGDYIAELETDQTLVVVSHGGASRVGVCAFLGLPRETWESFGGLNNCSWTVLEESGWPDASRWRLVEWNAGTLPEPVMSDDEPPAGD